MKPIERSQAVITEKDLQKILSLSLDDIKLTFVVAMSSSVIIE